MDALTASLALLRLEGLGPARYWQLIEHFGSPVRALRELPNPLLNKLPARAQGQWREFADRGESSALLRWTQDEIERCDANGVSLLVAGEDGYPDLLAQISRPPPVLYLRGNRDVLHIPQIALVGARRATTTGLENARAFAAELAAAGFGVTSGLALGVDAAAHRGALQVGGTTLAVLGSGVDRLYPRRNTTLGQEIIDNGGAVLSELPLGSAPEAANFPRRNRIISGLSLGVLLVEAAQRSGSLITARLALEQNREVFAIPGSIHNPMARGCHQMIKEGATLVESSADIVAQLGGILGGLVQRDSPVVAQQGAPVASLAPELQEIMRALGADPRSIEQLVRATGGDTGDLMAGLLQLELAGLVVQLSTGYQLTVDGERSLCALAD